VHAAATTASSDREIGARPGRAVAGRDDTRASEGHPAVTRLASDPVSDALDSSRRAARSSSAMSGLPDDRSVTSSRSTPRAALPSTPGDEVRQLVAVEGRQAEGRRRPPWLDQVAMVCGATILGQGVG
jgi:hypothetical protein